MWQVLNLATETNFILLAEQIKRDSKRGIV